MWTFESSLAETICFPSKVKDADVWLPAFLRPENGRRRELTINNKMNINFIKFGENYKFFIFGIDTIGFESIMSAPR